MKPLQPIQFPVRVNGEALTASILDFRSRTEMHLKFSNNYQNYFLLDEKLQWKTPGGRQLRGGDIYAAAVGDDLSAFLCVRYWEKAFSGVVYGLDGKGTNLWLFAKPGKNQYIYDVCYKGKLLFQMVAENNTTRFDWYDAHYDREAAATLEEKARTFVSSIQQEHPDKKNIIKPIAIDKSSSSFIAAY